MSQNPPVVLITGASGGIGRALAGAFAAIGADLVLTAHQNRARLDDFVADAPWRDRALVLAADVSVAASIDGAMAAAVERFGRVDVAVVNAGIGPPDEVPLHRMDEARIREVIGVNLLGAIFTARAFLAALARTGPRAGGPGANLVFVSSTAARFGEAGHAEYAASKAALGGLMLSLKNEIVALDPLGRSNLVEPGWTQTAMVDPELEADGIRRSLATMPLQRFADPADIASAVVWLASPGARHVSGQSVTVAGGMEGRVQHWPR